VSLRATRVTEHGQASRGSGVLRIDESRSVETGTGRFFPRLSGVTNDFDVDRWTRETGARRWTIARGTIDRLKSRALEVRSTCALVVARSVETDHRRSRGGEDQNRRASGPTDMRARSAMGDAEGEDGGGRASPSPSPSPSPSSTRVATWRFQRIAPHSLTGAAPSWTRVVVSAGRERRTTSCRVFSPRRSSSSSSRRSRDGRERARGDW